MISPGRYLARAVDAQLGFTQTNKEQVAVQFEIQEGEHQGKCLTWYGFFTEKTEKITLKALRTCGWQGDDITDLSGVTSNEVSLVVENEVDRENKTRPRIRWVNDVNGGGLGIKRGLDAGQAAALADRLRGRSIETRASAPGKVDPDCPFKP
jgi:hypothetical protein